MPRTVPALAAALLVAALLAGCGGRDPVPASPGRAVPSADPTGPTYAALDDGARVPGGSRVVAGGRTTRLPVTVSGATWLSSGDVLLQDGRRVWVLDPATGRRVGPSVAYGAGPSVSAGRILVPAYDARLIRVYDDRLRLLRTVTAPASAMRTHQPAKDPLSSLSILDPVVAGGVVWVRWAVDSEDDDLSDHGVLRIGRTARDVARDRPVVRLFPSSDGRSLLAQVRDHGHQVSCTGCSRSDDHVEVWDTRTGQVSDLGRPPGIGSWRVLALDRVGERVVVRFAVPKDEGTGSVQTWVRDDDGWTEQRPLRDTATRWQHGTPFVQALDVAQDEGDGAPYVLRYGGTTVLTTARACASGGSRCLTVTAPGSLLPD